MSLQNRVLPGTEGPLDGPGEPIPREMASKPLPDSKTQEDKENEKISLINALNPGDTVLVAGRPFPSLSHYLLPLKQGPESK